MSENEEQAHVEQYAEEETEEESDFVASGNEFEEYDDDLLFEENTIEGVELGCGVLQSNVEEDLDSEVDEIPYRSSEELHTDSSSDEEVGYRFPEFFAEVDMRNPKFEAGMKFRSLDEFKDAVRHYGVMNRFNVKFKVNDPKRVHAVCKSGCTWRIWASKMGKSKTVQVKSYTHDHQCTRDLVNRHCTYIFVANHYIETFRADPEWKTSSIIATVKEDLKVKLSRNVAWKARRFAKKLVEGTNEEQFGALWSYASEVIRTNPGSSVIIAVRGDIFEGIYICFNACKEGFVSGCRRVIGVDGCFLKGNYGGQLLTTVGLDANACIYPVAYAVVEKENTRAWRWFMTHLSEDIGMCTGKDWTLMSDRQKGLQNVLDELFPEAERRYCVRHMYSNFFDAGHKGKVLKDYLWRAAKSTTVADFKMWMVKIRNVSEDAHEWLVKKEPSEWSKSHFSTKTNCDILLNNGCEVFNKTLLDHREKSILTMLTGIQSSFMKRIRMRRDRMRRYKCQICPKIKQKLDRNIRIAEGCSVEASGGAEYQVIDCTGKYVVDLMERSCACRRWDLTGIPCSHAIAVMLEEVRDPVDYVDICYRVTTYLQCYEHIFSPINGKSLWPVVEDRVLKPPTLTVPKRGRKQKKEGVVRRKIS